LATDGLTLKVLAASVAATLGSAVANPTDLVKGLSAPTQSLFAPD